MSDASPGRAGWLSALSVRERDDFFQHLAAAVALRLDAASEEQLVSWEIDLGDQSDPRQAASTIRGFAASQRRQEQRIKTMAEHFEAMATIMAEHFE